MADPMQHLGDNFERLFGEQLAGTTPPPAPEPMPQQEMPVPVWAKREGVEL